MYVVCNREGCYEDLFADVESYPAVLEQKEVGLCVFCVCTVEPL